jgi:deazaflavin-dependent oxidoreductase (nitroreductase family)
MPFTSLVRRLGSRRWFIGLGKAVVPMDRYVGRMSRGRVSVLGMIGLPSCMITTTGRKSGQPRRQPLLYVPDGDGYVLVGSNWGGQAHPGWSANLLADPLATLEVRGRQIPVRAALAEGAERDRLWQLALRTWPAYQNYAAGTERTIRLFRLVPVESATRGG